ncbi:MAG TPA: sensor histidine kinase [Humibacillus xanthopallidus]|nr:sensor histidine kinase [Humibacillus xanthopallidus]
MTGPAAQGPAAPPTTGEDRSGSHGRDPWERYGWGIRAVWLVFLVFPLISIVGSGLPWWQVALGLLLVMAFGAVYVFGTEHLDRRRRRHCEPDARRGAAFTVALVVSALATVPFIGVGALSFLPFVVSFGMFALPLRWAVGIGVASVVAAVAVALLVDDGEGTWVVVIIVFAVGVMTAGIRVVSDRSGQYEAMSRELVLVAERERVARDVHDVLGHSLTVVTVKAELAERLVDLDPARAKAELAEIQALSRQALAEIRATVGGLRVARLGDEIASAAGALAGAGIEAHLPVGEHAVDVVDPRHRTVLAWVLREAVTNVVRHSDADECWVELEGNRLVVRDDGRGLEGRPEGNGIRGIRERVEAAGGRLSLTTGDAGHGTVLEVVL